MSVTLVYIGAVADLAPAASLRALGGHGAVFVPPGLADDLTDLVCGAAGSAPVVCPVPRLGELFEAETAEGAVAYCVAGDDGPAAARVLRALALEADVQIATVPPGELFDSYLIAQELVSLRAIVGVLRERCPWDREQNAQDIISYTIEETYELADAIAADDAIAEHGELGDLLLQVIFLAMLLEEQDGGDLGTIAAAIECKLIRRHAHIFGDAVAETPAAVRGQWERIKREQEGREGVFHDVPGTFPALLLARKLQERAAAVGFDWATAADAFPKIAEEHAELAEVLLGTQAAGVAPDEGAGAAPDRHDPHLIHEFGDLLFAVVNVARKAHVDPELALRAAAARFAQRVEGAAALAEADGAVWSALGLDTQEAYYQRAKAAGTAG